MEQESDIQIASLRNLSSARLPLCIPWSRTMKAVGLGTTFHSRLSATLDPWSKRCPFLDVTTMPIMYTNDDGGQATYVSAKSTSAGSSLEHLSMSLGLSVGCSFLGASVTGKYDKDVLENSDAKKASTKGTYRAGTITFERSPRLSDEGIIKIKYGGGIDEFENFYGDYYVAGCHLGADAAFMCSEGANSKAKTEALSIKAEVHAVFASKTYTDSKYFTDSSSNSNLQLSGFDTLSDTHLSLQSANGGSLGSLREQAAEIALKVDQLNSRVSSKLIEFNLTDNMRVSPRTVEEIFNSGLVVEVILLPVNKLRDVISWAASKDVI